MSERPKRVGCTSRNDIMITRFFGFNRWAVWFVPLFLAIVIGGYALLSGYPWGIWLVDRVAWMMIVGLALTDLVHRLCLTHFAMELPLGAEYHIEAKWWEKLLYRQGGWSFSFGLIPLPVWMLASGLAIFLAKEASWGWWSG
ncbi:membrane hypothetical protein [uncultured Gammaproteobacteria bacterium]